MSCSGCGIVEDMIKGVMSCWQNPNNLLSNLNESAEISFIIYDVIARHAASSNRAGQHNPACTPFNNASTNASRILLK